MVDSDLDATVTSILDEFPVQQAEVLEHEVTEVHVTTRRNRSDLRAGVSSI